MAIFCNSVFVLEITKPSVLLTNLVLCFCCALLCLSIFVQLRLTVLVSLVSVSVLFSHSVCLVDILLGKGR